ncbi:hypothetical protein B0H10DRAFT_1958669 [Mycena sp. CBHHK59/15]|nr:hypothetical protein B0H10DRAFT_1958669 [Mycena sp. CBHHK59/15]
MKKIPSLIFERSPCNLRYLIERNMEPRIFSRLVTNELMVGAGKVGGCRYRWEGTSYVAAAEWELDRVGWAQVRQYGWELVAEAAVAQDHELFWGAIGGMGTTHGVGGAGDDYNGEWYATEKSSGVGVEQAACGVSLWHVVVPGPGSSVRDGGAVDIGTDIVWPVCGVPEGGFAGYGSNSNAIEWWVVVID